MKIGFNYKRIGLALENMMNLIANNLSFLQSDIEQNASDIDTLQTNIQGYESRILQNEVDIERIDGNVSSCNTGISELANRVSTLESGGGGSDWQEITSINGQEAKFSQNFTEIRMLAKCSGGINYTVTVPYDSTIFHNDSSQSPTYIMCGNPIANNYGCKFKYMVTSNGEQYVCVDSCFNGGSYDAFEFRAWIR